MSENIRKLIKNLEGVTHLKKKKILSFEREDSGDVFSVCLYQRERFSFEILAVNASV